jgi:hypothetical protein
MARTDRRLSFAISPSCVRSSEVLHINEIPSSWLSGINAATFFSAKQFSGVSFYGH